MVEQAAGWIGVIIPLLGGVGILVTLSWQGSTIASQVSNLADAVKELSGQVQLLRTDLIAIDRRLTRLETRVGIAEQEIQQ